VFKWAGINCSAGACTMAQDVVGSAKQLSGHDLQRAYYLEPQAAPWKPQPGTGVLSCTKRRKDV